VGVNLAPQSANPQKIAPSCRIIGFNVLAEAMLQRNLAKMRFWFPLSALLVLNVSNSD
jgi:hypothetical protein